MQLTNFNPELSADKLKILWSQRQHITLEVVQELYKANEYYCNSGYRSDLVPTGTRLDTFEKYLNYAGIAKRTGYNWLERYVPEENKLITYNELQERKKIERQEKQQETIKNYDNDAFKDRIKKTFNEIEQRPKISSVASFEELKNNIKTAHDTIEQFINKEISKEEKIKKLRISRNNEIIDQEIYFESFRDYLSQFDNVNRQLEAIQNFIKYLRDLAVELQRQTI